MEITEKNKAAYKHIGVFLLQWKLLKYHQQKKKNGFKATPSSMKDIPHPHLKTCHELV